MLIAKDNQPSLHDAIRLIFEHRGTPDFSEPPTLDLRPHQATRDLDHDPPQRLSRLPRHRSGLPPSSAVSRTRNAAKSPWKRSSGSPAQAPKTARAYRLLHFNRRHWSIENGCQYVLDWNWDADRCLIRTGHGPENLSALRRFAIGVIKSKTNDSIASTIQRLARNVRLVFD